MGWSESGLVCKKHQNHNKNLPGVCPFCLGERLSQLSETSQMKIAVVAPSSSSSLFSSPASSSSTNKLPSKADRPRHNRNVSEMMGSVSLKLSAGNNGLKKSRSMAFVAENNSVKKKKKKGFWSKLLHLEGKKEILTHSRTVSVCDRG